MLPTQPWAFRSDTQREQLLYGGGDALAWLAGHRLHLRVTTGPIRRRSGRAGSTSAPRPVEGRRRRRRGVTTWSRCRSTCGTRRWPRSRSSWGCGCPTGPEPPADRRGLAAPGQHRARPAALPRSSASPRPSRSPAWTVARPRRGDGVAAASLHRDGAAGAGLAVAGRDGCVGRRRPAQLRRRRRLRRRASGSHRQVTSRGGTAAVERHVAVMSVGRLEEIEAPDPGHEPWLAHTDRLPFPVEWSASSMCCPAGKPGRRSSGSCWWCATCSGTTPSTTSTSRWPWTVRRSQARQVEDQMSRGVDVAAARVHGWFRLAVRGGPRRSASSGPAR